MLTNKNGTYILLISIHGLIRGHNLELGRDADTGGQTKYVVDLARALADHEEVEQVDLVTQLVVDPAVSKDYAQPIEPLSDKARIVRIGAGPEEYLAKEQLWDHLDSFTDNLISWLQDQPKLPDIIHSHYADAGYVAVRLTNFLGVPLIHTGHSLGRDKRKRLLAKGMSREHIEQTYNMERRIDAEEEVLAHASLVVTSTKNEIQTQYGLYNYYDPGRMTVIPPGTDLDQFYPPGEEKEKVFAQDLPRFLIEPDKPLILALSRPDERKNILTLVEAYGESAELQKVANLLIVAGTRQDIRDMEDGAQDVLTNILLLIDTYDLYGHVAFPKQHQADDVPSIYRLVAQTGGVFINPALTEPFGLTLLEAAASGLPVVATENGGPVDILVNCKNGELVDPLDKEAITVALRSLLEDRKKWSEAAENGLKGVRRHYSWQNHAHSYLEKIADLPEYSSFPPTKPPVRTIRYRDRALFTDLEQSLIGNSSDLARFSAVIREQHKNMIFGIATGRRIEAALPLIRKHRIPQPDILISGLGTKIHYGHDLTEDDYWTDHIDQDWSRKKILRTLAGVPGLRLQPKSEQSSFKISWYFDPEQGGDLDEIVTLLRQRELTVNVMLSFGQFLDIIPSRASKGQALRYVAHRLDIPLERILVAGGSGADEDMMRGNTLAVVVNNRHHEELSQLVEQDKVYFAEQKYAGGLLEALEYYDFFSTCKEPEDS
ncbi:MAG: HAD-IIB family hydrolase [Candidatus Electrothrix sp. AX1]|nr:HAD-IIB family hydrolase [Candidatus Electrothrix sp. AX1]